MITIKLIDIIAKVKLNGEKYLFVILKKPGINDHPFLECEKSVNLQNVRLFTRRTIIGLKWSEVHLLYILRLKDKSINTSINIKNKAPEDTRSNGGFRGLADAASPQ